MKDLRRLTLDQIRIFVAVAEQQSFTQAAEIHSRTQTAMTRQILNMEEILGERVLKRSRGHVEGLTEAGERLLPFARRILATVEDAWTSIRRPSVSGRIRVGVMDDIDIDWLNDLLARFRAIHPDCDIRAVSDFSHRLEQRVKNGELDLAVIKRPGEASVCGQEELIRSEPLLWAMGPGFRWNRGQPLPLVVFHEGCVYRELLIRKIKESGFKPQIVYEGQSYANVRAATYAGLGLTALAESQIAPAGLMRINRLADRRLSDIGNVNFMMRYRKGELTAAMVTFMEQVKNCSPGAHMTLRSSKEAHA